MKHLLPILLVLALLTSCARREGPVDIAVLNANSLPMPVAQSVGPAMVPVSMTPDGKWLLTTDDQHAGLYLTDLGTDYTRTITRSHGTGMYASFTPDGKRIAFKAFRQDAAAEVGFFEQAAFLHDVSGNRTHRITAWSPVVGTPAASIGGRIAVSVGDEIVILSRDLRQLSRYPVGHCSNLLAWSPDETQIAYSDARDRACLLDLAAGTSRVLIDDAGAYYGPVFSPGGDRVLFRTVTSCFSVVNLSTGDVHDHGFGDEPRWFDNDTVLFIEDQEALRSRHALRPTNDVASLGSPGTRWYTVAHPWTAGRRRDDILIHRINEEGKLERTRRLQWIKQDEQQVVPYEPHRGPDDQHAYKLPPLLLRTPDTVELIGVPYLHQMNHLLPGYLGEWACNAACAIMLLATHRKVDPIGGTRSRVPLDGAGEARATVSPFGHYITEVHSAGNTQFDVASPGPDGQLVTGAYGYIVREEWKDTRNYMADYMRAHGLKSEVDWHPTYANIAASIERSEPPIILHLITFAGHYTTAIGFVQGRRALIMNDPYGDKNSRFYPHPDGRRAIYDMPGYNNGYQNLRMIRCVITGAP